LGEGICPLSSRTETPLLSVSAKGMSGDSFFWFSNGVPGKSSSIPLGSSSPLDHQVIVPCPLQHFHFFRLVLGFFLVFVLFFRQCLWFFLPGSSFSRHFNFGLGRGSFPFAVSPYSPLSSYGTWPATFCGGLGTARFLSTRAAFESPRRSGPIYFFFWDLPISMRGGVRVSLVFDSRSFLSSPPEVSFRDYTGGTVSLTLPRNSSGAAKLDRPDFGLGRAEIFSPSFFHRPVCAIFLL